MKVITMSLYRRLDYTQQVLEALSKCDGIDEYQVFIHCEPGYPRVVEAARMSAIPNKEIVVNHKQLGCTLNINTALHHGFEHSDYVIHVEDDILFAKDALRYFEWANQKFKYDPFVFTVGGYHKEVVSPDKFYTYRRERWFTPWGWATWRDRYEFINHIISLNSTETMSWDEITNKCARGDRVQVIPLLSRTQNIGAVNGTYCPGPEWHRENQFNEFWAGMDGIDIDQTWRGFLPEGSDND